MDDERECWKTVVECVILALVIGFLLGVMARGADREYQVAFIRKADAQGFVVLHPMTPPSFGVRGEVGAEPPETGTVMLCKPFRRVVEVVTVEQTPIVVHETAMNCGEHGSYTVRAVLFQAIP